MRVVNRPRPPIVWLTVALLIFTLSEGVRGSAWLSLMRSNMLDVLSIYGSLFLALIGTIVPAAYFLRIVQSRLLAGRGHGIDVLIAAGVNASVWANNVRLLVFPSGLPSWLSVHAILVTAGALGILLAFRLPSFRNLLQSVSPAARWTCACAVTVSLAAVFGALVRAPVVVSGSFSGADSRLRPHVIVIVADAMGASDMSLYGYPLPTTPQLAEHTRDWTIYQNAHSTGTGTTAFMATLFTGRYPYFDQWWRYGDLARAGDGWLSMPDMLRQAGYVLFYATNAGYSPGMYHFQGGWAPGRRRLTFLDEMPGPWSEVSAMLQREYRLIWPPVRDAAPAVERFEETTVDLALDFFDSRKDKNEPVFALVHLSRPHDPYLANEYTGRFLPVSEGFTTAASQAFVRQRQYPPERQADIDRLRLRYNENILKADAEISRLLGELKSRGMYDNALIIVTADHGSNFKEGFVTYYTPRLFRTEHHVPLLVKSPGQRVGRRVDSLVSSVDLAPSILAEAGIAYESSRTDGVTFAMAEATDSRVIFVRRPNEHAQFPVLAVLTGDLKVVLREDGVVQFDLRNDPGERLPSKAADSRLLDALNRFQARAAELANGGNPVAAIQLP